MDLKHAEEVLERVIVALNTADPIRRVHLEDQLNAITDSWWKRFVAEEFGGVEPSWARKRDAT